MPRAGIAPKQTPSTTRPPNRSFFWLSHRSSNNTSSFTMVWWALLTSLSIPSCTTQTGKAMLRAQWDLLQPLRPPNNHHRTHPTLSKHDRGVVSPPTHSTVNHALLSRCPAWSTWSPVRTTHWSLAAHTDTEPCSDSASLATQLSTHSTLPPPPFHVSTMSLALGTVPRRSF